MSQTLWPAKPRKVDRSLFRRPKKDKNHNLSWYKEYIMHIQRLLRDRFWQLVDKLEKKVLLALYKLLASWVLFHIRDNGRKERQNQRPNGPVRSRLDLFQSGINRPNKSEIKYFSITVLSGPRCQKCFTGPSPSRSQPSRTSWPVLVHGSPVLTSVWSGF